MTTNDSNTQLKLIQSNTLLSQKEKDIIVGTILGDANLKSNKYRNSVSLKYGYGNKIYAEFVLDGLKRLSNYLVPNSYKGFDYRYNKERTSYTFYINTNPSFTPFGSLFLKPCLIGEGKYKFIKVLPDLDTLYELITPRALAYWIMDDGAEVKSGGLTLCTDNFSVEEVLRLKTVLETKYNFICTIHIKKENKKKEKLPLQTNSTHPNLISNVEFKDQSVNLVEGTDPSLIIEAEELSPNLTNTTDSDKLSMGLDSLISDTENRKSKRYHRIYISSKSLPFLNTLVSSYMLPEMLYKIKYNPVRPLSQTLKNIKNREESQRIRDWQKLYGPDSMPPKK